MKPPPILNTTPAKPVSITTLERHPDNPRRGVTPAIIESIKTTGFYGALIVQKNTNRVLAGNHRLDAAKAAGMTTVPVIYVDVDDHTARRILLADNRTSDLGTYDLDHLNALLEQVAAHDPAMTGTGYTPDDLASLLDQLAPAYTPATPDEPEAAAPGTPAGAHTPETVAAAQQAEEERTSRERELHPAMCPECGHEFYVD